MNKKKSVSLKKCTGILIRFDDIAPNMNWQMMERCEVLLNKFNIISQYTKLEVIALGGISKQNVKKLNLLHNKGFAGISYFE